MQNKWMRRLLPLLQLGGGLEGVTPGPDPAGGGAPDFDDPGTCDAASRAVPDAVLHLMARHGG